MNEEEIIKLFENFGFLDGLVNKRNTALSMDCILKTVNPGDKRIPMSLPILRKIFNDEIEDVNKDVISTIVNELLTVLELSEVIIEIRKKMDRFRDVEAIYSSEVADRLINRLNEMKQKG